MTLTVVKEHELMSYEALSVIDGLFFKFTNVKLNGPNKSFEHQNNGRGSLNLTQVWSIFINFIIQQ